ncbi:hypothetical protein CDL15_Pgr007251 [Punica granatum]|uniref:Uncharacterized protein n=1 Tax=Punica granatum TaxID=22663 RepID=A0A218X934_PUNGR|nr:hypothetical protein CDL15_Pgr007251 [Punica granatum]
MDLLCSAYSNSDVDGDEREPKKLRPENPIPVTSHHPKPRPWNVIGRQGEAPVQGNTNRTLEPSGSTFDSWTVTLISTIVTNGISVRHWVDAIY